MEKKVSIIVISYNAKDDLMECLASLERMDYDKKEIIVVNDASTDDTSAFLRHYKRQRQTNMKIKVINNEKNLGVAGARNVGIRHASGEILAFTDSDCVTDRGWISELVKMYDHKDVAAVGGSIKDGRITNIWELSDKGHDFVAIEEGYVSYIQGCNMSFKSNVLKKFMFNDEIKYGYEEKLLCDYLIDNGFRIYYRPKAVVYHKHRNTMLSSLRRKYLLGVSSIWYRKKQNKLFMFKRHIIFLISLFLFPLSLLSTYFFYLSFFLFLFFSISLLRDEFIFKAKSIREIIITFPFLIFIELSHLLGTCVGFVKFRI